jgi:hypothetical protein
MFATSYRRPRATAWDPALVDSVDPGERLTKAELSELARLLARYAAHDLDQWEHWRIQTAYGPVYVIVANRLPPDCAEETFTTIWPLPTHLAARPPGVRAARSVQTARAAGVRERGSGHRVVALAWCALRGRCALIRVTGLSLVRRTVRTPSSHSNASSVALIWMVMVLPAWTRRGPPSARRPGSRPPRSVVDTADVSDIRPTESASQPA